VQHPANLYLRMKQQVRDTRGVYIIKSPRNKMTYLSTISPITRAMVATSSPFNDAQVLGDCAPSF